MLRSQTWIAGLCSDGLLHMRIRYTFIRGPPSVSTQALFIKAAQFCQRERSAWESRGGTHVALASGEEQKRKKGVRGQQFSVQTYTHFIFSGPRFIQPLVQSISGPHAPPISPGGRSLKWLPVCWGCRKVQSKRSGHRL